MVGGPRWREEKTEKLGENGELVEIKGDGGSHGDVANNGFTITEGNKC